MHPPSAGPRSQLPAVELWRPPMSTQQVSPSDACAADQAPAMKWDIDHQQEVLKAAQLAVPPHSGRVQPPPPRPAMLSAVALGCGGRPIESFAATCRQRRRRAYFEKMARFHIRST